MRYANAAGTERTVSIVGTDEIDLDFTDSVVFTCSTDYLVICGRAFARSMDAAGATLESPLDKQ